MSKISGYAKQSEPKWLYVVLIILLVLFCLFVIYLAGLVSNWWNERPRNHPPTTTTSTTIIASSSTTQATSPSTTMGGKITTTTQKLKTVENNAGLRVEKIVISSKVDSRNLPIDEITKVSGISKVYCYTRITGNLSSQAIRHVWIDPNGAVAAEVKLNLRNNPADTWSFIGLGGGATGEWTVRVESADGQLLAKKNFTFSNSAEKPF